MNKAVLTAVAVTKTFIYGPSKLEVLHAISADFLQGTTYAITGPSGSGKSTLLHILAGIDTPTRGAVLYNGRAIARFLPIEQADFLNKHVGLVFQNPYLIDELSVIENVMIKGIIGGDAESVCKKKAKHLLEQVGLGQKIYSRPSTLSGGQQQRVALVRALFNEPTLLLADEPTGNLDEQTGNDLIDFILECHKQWGMGIVISSHDEYVTQKMDVILRLKNGVLHEKNKEMV